MTSQVRGFPVVAGIDGSSADHDLLAWAAAEAQRRRSELLIAHARDVVVPSSVSQARIVSVLSEDACFGDDLVNAAQAFVTDTQPSVAVRTVLRTAQPAELLVDLSADASMVVVGTRGANRFVGAMLGSVSQKVAAHARCPVVVLPCADVARWHAQTSRNRVVVGVSSSDGGRAALRFAFAEAQFRDAELIAVHSWSEPNQYGGPTRSFVSVLAGPLDVLSQCGQVTLDEEVDAVARDYPDVKVGHRLSGSSADQLLDDHARDADLLVVGCRHEDGGRRSRLGPIGSWLLHQSVAPIAVVGFSPGPARPRSDRNRIGEVSRPDRGLRESSAAPLNAPD